MVRDQNTGMICRKCEKSYPASFRYCENCGGELAAEETEGPAELTGPKSGFPDSGTTGRHVEIVGGNKIVQEQRVRCQLPECGQAVFETETFVCSECNRRMCQRHKDEELLALCARCAERRRDRCVGPAEDPSAPGGSAAAAGRRSSSQAERRGELCIALPHGVRLDLTRVSAGEFTMGSSAGRGRDSERPARRAKIGSDYYLGRFPVTQEQYQALADENPSRFTGARHPVDSVAWSDARAFCRKLRSHLALCPDAFGGIEVSAAEVGLPTEAQWEYACRAGTDTAYFFGNDAGPLVDFGWFSKNSDHSTRPVGELRPNPWGLCDMYGNVWEWCGDYWAPDYSGAAFEDPAGPSAGHRRILRGGSWSYYAKDCRSARRHAAPAEEATANYGFRIALTVSRE